MHLVYSCKIPNRLLHLVVSYCSFYIKASTLLQAVEIEVGEFLEDGLREPPMFSIETLSEVFLQTSLRTNREFAVVRTPHNSLVLSIKVWPNGKFEDGSIIKLVPSFASTLEVDNDKVSVHCNDAFDTKLAAYLLTNIAFKNGVPYHDDVIVDGETFKMAYYIAACFYKLGGDLIGYNATLDESRDKA